MPSGKAFSATSHVFVQARGNCELGWECRVTPTLLTTSVHTLHVSTTIHVLHVYMYMQYKHGLYECIVL
jgi:hypothetical protein